MEQLQNKRKGTSMKYAYVGCRTTRKRNARGQGLTVYEIQPEGGWLEKQCLFTEDNPSYQCFDLKKEYLYSVHGDLSLLSSYKIHADGTLSHLNTVDIGGKNPVDITVDGANRHIIAATLQGGSIYTVRRREDGSLGEVTASYTYEGKAEGMVSAIHQCLWDRDRRYLLACAQGRANGYGQLRALLYHPENGTFTETGRFLSRTWDEPRHAAVHPNNQWVYMCEEKGNKVVYLQFNANDGSLKALQELSTVPETVTGYSDASEIAVDPSGEYVLVSNRYTDLFAIYRINPQTGYLHTAGFTPCLGKTPRFFCFAPNGRCYAAHEDSDTIVEFTFQAAAGQLLPTGSVIHTGSPVCISFL